LISLGVKNDLRKMAPSKRSPTAFGTEFGSASMMAVYG
jgi:hypothetical protein